MQNQNNYERSAVPAFRLFQRATLRGLLPVLCLYLGAPGQAEAASFFVQATGSGMVCTQSEPCDLQTALAAANDADTVYVAAGTYTGTGDNVVELSRSVQFYGGWDGAGSGPVVRNPAVHVTILDGEHSRRVLRVLGSKSPVIDGFTITNGDATGLHTDCSGANREGCGGGILAYGGTPTISNNIISNNVAAATINYPTTTTGEGGGVALIYSIAQVVNNTFSGNTACQAPESWGEGGGLYAHYTGTGAVIENNRFINNTATLGNETGWGGGVAVQGSDVRIEGNLFQGNTGTPLGSAYGSGLFWWYVASSGEVRGNVFTENARGSTVYLGFFSGIFEANRVTGNQAETALDLVNEAGAGMKWITNNILSGEGTHAVLLDGYSAYPVHAVLTNNTLAGMGGQYGLQITEYATAQMVNNIITGSTVAGVSLVDPGSITLTQDHTLFWNNGTDGERGTDPVDGDPAYADPGKNDFHIRASSAGRDRGTATGAPAQDIDGQSRPWGVAFDIGADEFVVPGPPAGVTLLLLD